MNRRYLWDVVTVLISKEIKLRYRGTFFGILWSLANPLAFTLVLYIAFKRVLHLDIQNYPLFILSALFPWQWLSNSLTGASSLFVSNAPLIKKLVFPRYALCLALVLGEMIHFIVTLPVLALVYYFSTGAPPSAIWVIGIPILLVTQTLLTLGGVIIFSTVNAFFRDIEQLIRVFLLFIFYLTPILYPASMVPDGLQWLMLMNPFAPLIIAWRALLADQSLSPYMVVAVGHAMLALICAFPIYRNMEWRLAEVV
jgi:lipopolysaccharide transport system permease protein